MSGKSKISLYRQKHNTYFSNTRHDLIELIPQNRNKILEIGCGTGATLIALKKLGKADYVSGVDIVDLNQKEELDKFICCDIEKEVSSLPFANDFFDIIICADILEHLIDPWKVVKELKRYLKKDGILIASIPNIREIKTMLKIFFKGDFLYENEGILDKTHLRFFCKKNIIDLFKKNGYTIEKITYNLAPKRNILNKMFLGFLEEFLVAQYIVLARNTQDNEW